MTGRIAGIPAIICGALLIVTACAPAATPTQAPGPGDGAGRPGAVERTLIVGIEFEPFTLAALHPSTSGASSTFIIRPFNALIDFIDDKGIPSAYLAEALPRFNTDTWRVFADGRMETRYTLRPGVTWHDGTALSAEDFAFAFRAASTPNAGFALSASPPLNLIDDVAAPDDRTIIIRWKQLYPDAAVLQSGGSRMGLPPFPRHILEGPLTTQLDTFAIHPYWTREFIGLGPYKLDKWELGSYVEGIAFDKHVGGRPKIDRIRLTFIDDPNTVLANMQAGALHIAADALSFEQAIQLKRAWAPTQGGTVVITATSMRKILFQLRPEYQNQRALSDLRVRKALAHAVDKDIIRDTYWDGEVMMLDSIFDPRLAYWPAIDAATLKYRYDPRESERLMNEAGYARGGDGLYASASQGRFEAQLRGSQGSSERPIVAASWRQAGFDAVETTLSAAQARDPEAQSNFPSMSLTATGADENNQTAMMLTGQIGNPENRWRGANRAGWSSAEYDRLVDAFNTTLDPQERIPQRAAISRLLTEELPAVNMSFNPNSTVYVAALRGPSNGAVLGTTGLTAWNIVDWELR
ncbi:MAG: hypothetical protein HW416_726 [Chloroflexi bacterium]|nr:hypothetical protein [Chloroflexota bacterium]